MLNNFAIHFCLEFFNNIFDLLKSKYKKKNFEIVRQIKHLFSYQNILNSQNVKNKIHGRKKYISKTLLKLRIDCNIIQ